MKRIYTLLLLLSFPLCLFASGTGGHEVKIQIKGFAKDSTARIGHYFGRGRYVAQDTAEADKNGLLVFKGKKKLPEGVYICLWSKGYFEFLVTEQSFSLETDTMDLELHMKVKGSKENKYFYEFRKYTTRQGRKVDSLNKILKAEKDPEKVKALKEKIKNTDKEVEEFRKSFIAKYPGTYTVKLMQAIHDPEVPEMPTLPNGAKDSTFPYRYFKTHYFDNIDFSDDRMVRTPFFVGKLDYYLKNLVVPEVDSINRDVDNIIEKSKANDEMFKYILSWMLNHFEESQYMGMDAVTCHIIEKYYLTGQAKWITELELNNMRKRYNIMNPLLIGKTAPDMYLTDSIGKAMTLYGVKKKYVVLYFWDSDCGHCQHATPLMHDFYERNKDSIDLAVYAVTIERKTEKWKKYIREHKLGDWINVWDSFTVTEFKTVYDIYSTPVIYILDANKKIIAKRMDVEQLQDFFDRLEKRDRRKKP